MNNIKETPPFRVWRAKNPASLGLAPNSAIVTPGPSSSLQPCHGYYEGNLYGTQNLNLFEEKARCAAGRLATRYPTIAQRLFKEEDLEFLGTYGPPPSAPDATIKDWVFLPADLALFPEILANTEKLKAACPNARLMHRLDYLQLGEVQPLLRAVRGSVHWPLWIIFDRSAIKAPTDHGIIGSADTMEGAYADWASHHGSA